MPQQALAGRAAALVNYDPKQPTLASLAPWRNPALVKIFFSVEFWLFMGFHAAVVFGLQTEIIPELPVDWKASGAFQYFTTFFLTFYNGNCYARYQTLYTNCCDLMDAALLFVRELVICFKDETTWKHRLQAVKWLLAGVDLFFMGVCGNKLSMKEWSEVVKKGLLTKPEAQLLLKYPGPEVVPILMTWTMMAVTDALELPCFHERKNPDWFLPRIQKIAHLHNRLDLILTKLTIAYRTISETMAQPIPFAYWHLMNLVFSLNFLLLALILASFGHWLTIVPYSMALMTFMGLREVSNQLADPFGDDIVDFPLAKYLDYTFDHSVCLLQAFSANDAYDRVRRQIYSCTPFNDRQFRRHVKPENLYSEAFAAHTDCMYIWEKEQPLAECATVYEKESLQDQLRKSLSAIPVGKHEPDYEGGFDAKTSRIGDNQVRWLQEAEEELDRMRQAAPKAADELDRVENRVESTMRELLGETGGTEGNARSNNRRSSTGDAGAGVSRMMGDESLGVESQENDSPTRVVTAREMLEQPATPYRAFQWGQHKASSRTHSERSFRAEDVSFSLATDQAGRLKRQQGSSAAGLAQTGYGPGISPSNGAERQQRMRLEAQRALD